MLRINNGILVERSLETDSEYKNPWAIECRTLLRVLERLVLKLPAAGTYCLHFAYIPALSSTNTGSMSSSGGAASFERCNVIFNGFHSHTRREEKAQELTDSSSTSNRSPASGGGDGGPFSLPWTQSDFRLETVVFGSYQRRSFLGRGISFACTYMYMHVLLLSSTLIVTECNFPACGCTCTWW